jgi:hypothetical protein
VFFAVGAAVVVAASALVWYAPRLGNQGPAGPSGPGPRTSDLIEGVDLTFSYTTSNVSDANWLSPPPQCNACPFNDTPGALWIWSFNLTNTDASSHTLTAITIEAPFVLESDTPTLPYTLAAYGSVTCTLELSTPTNPGAYFLTGTVDTD